MARMRCGVFAVASLQPRLLKTTESMTGWEGSRVATSLLANEASYLPVD